MRSGTLTWPPRGCWTCRAVAIQHRSEEGRLLLLQPRPHVALPTHPHPASRPLGTSLGGQREGRLIQPASHLGTNGHLASTASLKLKVGALFWEEIFKGTSYFSINLLIFGCVGSSLLRAGFL